MVLEKGKEPELRTKIVYFTDKLKGYLDCFEYDEEFKLLSIVPIEEALT
jgi:hypothetical protein